MLSGGVPFGIRLDGLHLSLLVEVVAICIEQQVIREAVIENPIAGTQHGLGLLSAFTNAIRKRDPGSKIYFVGNVVLRLEAQPIADREVGPRLPVVLCIEAQVGDAGFLRGRSGGDRELAGLAGKVGIQIRVGVRSLKVCVGIIRVLVVAQPATEADVMLGQSQRSVVLKLVFDSGYRGLCPGGCHRPENSAAH